MNDIVDVSPIRALNDELRQSLSGGVVVMTAGVRALGEKRKLEILEAVGKFDGFDADNDPYGEHDFGALQVDGERLFFKIDYLTGRSRAARPIQPTRPSPRACSPSCWLRST